MATAATNTTAGTVHHKRLTGGGPASSSWNPAIGSGHQVLVKGQAPLVLRRAGGALGVPVVVQGVHEHLQLAADRQAVVQLGEVLMVCGRRAQRHPAGLVEAEDQGQEKMA